MIDLLPLHCIIVAGGSGTRMGSEIPKQLMELHGRPVLMHTIEQFYRFNSKTKLIVALPTDQQDEWMQLCEKHSFRIVHEVVKGGITRFHSVKNALARVGDEGLVAVHDGVRPLVSLKTIKRCFDAALSNGAAIPVIPVSDSVRKVEGDSSVSLDRSTLRLVQTPQIFSAKLLQDAYKVPFNPDFTDDASVVEYAGIAISLVAGNPENIKITYASDLIIASSLLIG